MNTCAKRMLVAVGLFLLVASWAIAEEPFDGQTQTWRGLFFTMKVDTLSMEPLGGTVVGAREVSGLAFYDNGEVAMVDGWLSFFRVEGRSNYEGYAVFRFPDGSTQTASLEGCISATGAETCEFSFVCGSGRFDGIVGDGSFASDGFSLADDPFVHARSTYRLLTD
jgi:hypothetical protein